MPTYEVTAVWHRRGTFIIEADSRDDAYDVVDGYDMVKFNEQAEDLEDHITSIHVELVEEPDEKD